MYKTEIHCHSNDVSACARVDAETIVEHYVAGGYSTVVLTNHFNGDTYNHLKAQSWDEFIDKYVFGYEKLKKTADGKLNVILGMELRVDENWNDYLIFGITEEFMRSHEYFYKMPIWEFSKLAKENGFLVIQAHPFRHNMTIVNTDFLDGIEVYNGHKGHNSNNDIAEMYADKYSLIKTSGTDFHYSDVPTNAGIKTEDEIKDIDTLISVLKSGKYELIKE